MVATQDSVGKPPDGRLYAGSCGFSYPEWRGSFYPEDARAPDFLRLYAGRLNAVEVNSTFRRLPRRDQLARWAEQVPPGFRFAVRMSARITHGGDLGALAAFEDAVRGLGDRLGPVLVRLPDERPRDDGFLALLSGSLDPALELAFDLRHPSWDGVEGIVRVGDLEADAPFRYLRPRDPPWDDGALAALAADVEPLLARGVDVHCFFNRGDAPDHSPGGEPTAVAAERLLRLAARRPPPG